jgi:hypothetical protein
MKNGSQINQTKLLSSNPDRLDLLFEFEHFSEVLSPVVQPQAIIDGRWPIIIKKSALSARTLFLIWATLSYCLDLINNQISRTRPYIYAISFALAQR